MAESFVARTEQPVRRIVLAALIPVALTLVIHALLGDPAGYPSVPVSPFAIAPYDHTGPLQVAGLRDLAAFALLLAQYALVVIILAYAFRGLAGAPRFAQVGLGLLVGGGFSNSIETLLRGATLDYLWIDVGNHMLIVANVADGALAAGVILLTLAIARTERSRQGS